MADKQTVLVTGANVGLGLETCRQLAEKGVGKIILACRNPEKAKAAIKTLVAKTGKQESTFSILEVDTGSLESCRKAATMIETPLDAVVMNAGGVLFNIASKQDQATGAHTQFVVNVLGHAVFLEELIQEKKLVKGAHIMFSGSEGSRGVALMGMKPCKFKKPLKEDMISHITGEAYKKFDPMYAYTYTKAIGQLYISQIAADNPDYTIVSVSPGATSGTKAAAGMPAPFRIMMNAMMPTVMRATGFSHPVSKGAQNYLSGIGMGPTTVPTGKFFAARKGKTSGRLVDQGENVDPIYGSKEYHLAAYEAVRSFLK